MKPLPRDLPKLRIGPPEGVGEDECQALEVQIVESQFGRAFESIWDFEPEERIAIAAGAPLILTITAPAHPVVHLGIASGDEYALPSVKMLTDGKLEKDPSNTELALSCSIMATALERDGMPNAALYMRAAVNALTKPLPDDTDEGDPA